MRPLHLSLEGFTCFRDRAEVDFSDLDLFAITGPTGAGKSSLVDAITWVLYGRVSRLDGREVKDLIAQGMTAMTVTFEFAVGEGRYRVLRSVSTRGAARVRFERFDPGEGGWIAEEGKVRDTDERVRRLLGLDYEGFIRSVVLPQNQFHLFLAGEAKQRRDILTELLGLEVYNSVRTRATDIATSARADVGALETRLREDFAGATAEALADCRRQLAEASAAAERATAEVSQLEDAWRLAETAGRLAEEALAAGRRRAEAEQRLAEAAALAADGQGREQTVGAELEALRTRLAATPFDAAEYGRLRETVARSQECDQLAERLDGLRQRVRQAQAAAAAAGEQRDAARTAATEAETIVAATRERRERLLTERHADFVRSRLEPGQACPVCGQTVHALPPAGDRAPLEAADRELKSAEAGLEACRSRLLKAEAQAAAATAAAEQAARQVADAEEDVSNRRAALAAETGLPPQGRTAALQGRLEALEQARRLHEELTAGERDLAAALERLRADLRQGQERAAAARAEAEQCARLAAELEANLERERTSLAALAESAGWPEVRQALDAGEDARPPVRGRREAARATLGETLARRGALAAEVERIARGIEQAAALREQLQERRGEMEVAAELARLLQANRFQAFVQEEALQVLAQDGSGRLEELSQGRYALTAAGQEFAVIDHWNADESRPVKTLSGGETFLASLALALALAGRLPDLGGGAGRSALESLFLDEGFGSLDEETLEVVAHGIEAMRSDHRVVGIITHIPELAARMPARIEVIKSEAGSRLRQD